MKICKLKSQFTTHESHVNNIEWKGVPYDCFLSSKVDKIYGFRRQESGYYLRGNIVTGKQDEELLKYCQYLWSGCWTYECEHVVDITESYTYNLHMSLCVCST